LSGQLQPEVQTETPSNMKHKRAIRIAAALLPVLLASLPGTADAATYLTSHTFGASSVAPAAPAPWLTLTTQSLPNGKVEMKFEATGLTGAEFVSAWYLNVDPTTDPTLLVFENPEQTGSFELPTISLGANAFLAGPDGLYDILLEFSTAAASQGAKRFTNGDSLTYVVSRTGGLLDEGSLDYFSAPSGPYGPFHNAAKIQATGSAGLSSAWVQAVPEPHAALQAALLASGLLMLRRRHCGSRRVSGDASAS
jgi:hypothetical protein